MFSDRLRRAVRATAVALCLFGGLSAVAPAQVRIGVGIALPGVRIGVNIPTYPNMAPIPGYPIYYAPQLDENLFFYDGTYWLFADDAWYSSTWYNGPWYPVGPYLVPSFILRIPVGFYRRPPLFFRGWDRNAAPRWDEHWGPQWQRRRPGWDRWNRGQLRPRAPLPGYQRNYPRGRYPNAVQQRTLGNRYYRAPQQIQLQPRNERQQRNEYRQRNHGYRQRNELPQRNERRQHQERRPGRGPPS